MITPLRGWQTSFGEAGFCGTCQRYMPQGVDACLGVLDGVSHACCGHGDADKAYVVIGGFPDQDATTIEKSCELRGQDAIDYFREVEQARSRSGSVVVPGGLTPWPSEDPSSRRPATGSGPAEPQREAADV